MFTLFFTVQELQDLFNCATEKAIKIKKELQIANLLKQIQMGFNPKTKKNEPNRLYLSKLDVKATDVYLRGEHGQETPKSLATSEITKKKKKIYKDSKNIDTNRYSKVGLFHSPILTSRTRKAKQGFGEPC